MSVDFSNCRFPERVVIEWGDDFIRVTRGSQRWCFPRVSRPLTLREQLTLEALALMERAQSMCL